MTLELLPRTVDAVPIEVKRALIEQDIQLWQNTLFQATSRHRTAKRIGDAEGEAAQVKMIERCEGALLDLQEQLEGL